MELNEFSSRVFRIFIFILLESAREKYRRQMKALRLFISQQASHSDSSLLTDSSPSEFSSIIRLFIHTRPHIGRPRTPPIHMWTHAARRVCSNNAPVLLWVCNMVMFKIVWRHREVNSFCRRSLARDRGQFASEELSCDVFPYLARRMIRSHIPPEHGT